MSTVTLMELMSPTDSMFLLGESREHPMHVAGLQLFEPPAGAGPDFVRDMYETIVKNDDFQPTFRKHPGRMLGGVSNVVWAFDDDVDIDYHLRRSALPRPGRVRDLLELVSRLHGTLLDRHRPLWEASIVEGLSDGRFAVYTKTHHALLDGISAQRIAIRSMTTDPNDRDMRVPWTLAPKSRKPGPSRSTLRSLIDAAGSVAALAPSTLSVARAALIEQQLTLPFRAPKTMFNVPIGGARRVAAQSWPLARIKGVKNASGATVNDVVLAMCSGALRAYLSEQEALPDTPLVAMVPVSLRSEHEQDAGGNMVGTILCNLATDIEDPAKRLEAISTSMRANKKVFAELPRMQALAAVGVPQLRHRPCPSARLRLVGAATVQHRHLQRARCARADVLERRPTRRQLPAVHRPGRPGPQHHTDQQRGQPRLRPRRLSPQRATPAATARTPRGFPLRAGTRLRNLKSNRTSRTSQTSP